MELQDSTPVAVKPTLLIVDDDSLIRQQLEKELKRSYFNTLTAASGAQAIEIISRERIDILLQDVNLPDIDGFELLEKIKKQQPQCQVIVITGFGSEEVAIQALRRGAIDYIEKPVSMDVLTAALGRAQEQMAQSKDIIYQNTVLIIDDEEEVMKRLKRFLEKEKYIAFGATSARQGLEIIEHNKIDVVLTDIKMEEMDGIEFLKRAKALYTNIEGIVITGYKEGDMAIKALRAGASDYITKPVDLDQLLVSISRALERINLNRTRLYRNRELKISQEITAKINEELERRIEERSKELNKTQSQLAQTSKLATLGEMATGLAHEINQPLSGISFVALTFKKLKEKQRLTDQELDSGIKDIERCVERMSLIIKHIRIFARQETLNFKHVKVSETIDNAMSLMGEQLRLREIEVARTEGPGIPEVVGEPFQLEQVWINFISNARDAMDTKKEKMKLDGYKKKLTVNITFSKETNKVCVAIQDNGIGMNDQTRKKSIEPFFTTKEVGKGTGLGLSISYGIIESHKGNLEIESREGEGTTIKVFLPVGENKS